MQAREYIAWLPTCPVCTLPIGATFGIRPGCRCKDKDLRAHISRLEDFIEWQFEDEVAEAWDDYDAAISREAARFIAKEKPHAS